MVHRSEESGLLIIRRATLRLLPVAPTVKYTENDQRLPLDDGLWGTPYQNDPRRPAGNGENDP